MRDLKTAAVAAIAMIALSGTAFAGGACGGLKSHQQSAETADAGKAALEAATVESSVVAVVDGKSVVWSGTSEIGTSVGLAKSVSTATGKHAMSKSTLTKTTMVESTN